MANAAGLCLALFVLNSALTFQNRWPTVGVRWVPELSIELTALLLGCGEPGAVAVAGPEQPATRIRPPGRGA